MTVRVYQKVAHLTDERAKAKAKPPPERVDRTVDRMQSEERVRSPRSVTDLSPKLERHRNRGAKKKFSKR